MGESFTKELVYDGNSYNNAFISMDNGIAEVYKVKTDIGLNLEATYNHQIACIDQKGEKAWKTINQIQEGDWVIVVLGGHNGKEVNLPKINEQYFNATPIKIPEKMTPELGEILGLYMADACLSTGGRMIFSIDNRDSDLIHRIEDLMFLSFGLKIGRKEDNGSWSDLIFYSHDLNRFFEKMEWKKESPPKAFIPREIFLSHPEVAKAFIRGLFEGDGNTHTYGYPKLYSTSRKLIEQTQQLLLGLNVVSSYSVKQRRGNGLNKKPIYTLKIVSDRFLRVFNKEIGFITKRKRETFESRYHENAFEYNDIIPNQGEKLKHLSKYIGKGSSKGREKRGANRKFYRAIQHFIGDPSNKRNLTRKRLKFLQENFDIISNNEHFANISNPNYYFTQVKKIVRAKAYTMDIEVPGSHQFVANGILIHNRRRGANMGILRVDHPDIMDFIHCKEDLTTLNNFNISVGLTEAFMEAVIHDDDYPLVNPRNNQEVARLKAWLVFNEIVKMAHINGEPGILFLDRINSANPTPNVGEIEATNPCGEQPLLPYESCNLGSVNLSKMVKRDAIDPLSFHVDYTRLERVLTLAVRFLDNVIDVSTFPLPEIERMTRANRKIGLGVMGFADLLIKLGIPYNSQKGIELAKRVMTYIHTTAIRESQRLAKERGSFPNFEKSIYVDKYPMMRNATLTTLAPTGSLSIIAGCSSGIEPLFMLTYERRVLDDDILVEGYPFFVEIAKKRGFYSQELMETVAKAGSIREITEIPEEIRQIFVTAHDISPEWHVRMQAAFQTSGVDNAVSKTINFPQEATEEEINNAYMLAYELGCKGLTVYRSGSRTYDVLSKKGTNEVKTTPDEELKSKKPRYRPDVTRGITERVRVGCGTNLFITINEDEEGLAELFLSLGKSGGCVASHIESMGRLISLALRSRIESEEIILQLKSIRCPSPTFGSEGPILSCADAVAKSIERFINRYSINNHHRETDNEGEITVNDSSSEGSTIYLSHTTSGLRPECPECGNLVEHSEGCILCRVCGYSKCG
ncbi:MAG: adenosylcobalamin-dependent ribonucleoside-diphosphate reductase [Promethearchaeota archaeon]